MKWLDSLKYDSKGLIPAIIQDYQNNQVLMMAFMNKLSLQKTLDTGLCHYWSRSRQELWLKGGTSGHVQAVKEIFFDCDNDCLLFKVEQKVAACHTGMRSCFYRRYENGQVKEVGQKIFEAEKVYKKEGN